MQLEKQFKVIAKTSFGLEEVLAEELKHLGATDIEVLTRAVLFSSDKQLLYKANICLRTANRLLVPFFSFNITSVDDLYKQVHEYAWEKLFDVDQTFAIDSTVFSEMFNHTKFAALKTKDAIADRFREVNGKRPDVDTDAPDIRINLHINNLNECTICLDSSGDPLFKRGYRDSRSIAPIKEDLAAGLILLTGWEKDCTFVDLFCGSGTILIEAAMIAYNIAPNLHREAFGFMHWKSYDDNLFEDVLDAAEDQTVDFDYKIIGTEIDHRVLGMCKTNIKAAGLEGKIELYESDFKDFAAPSETGIIVSNPPYGERIGEHVEDMYKEFGDNLKLRYNGWNAWFLSSNMEALKQVGLRPSRKVKVFNGSLECRMMKYEMYRGTKKIHKLEGKEETETPAPQDIPKKAVFTRAKTSEAEEPERPRFTGFTKRKEE